METPLEDRKEKGLELWPRFRQGIADFFFLLAHWLEWFFDFAFLGILGGLVGLIKKNRKVAVGAKIVVSAGLFLLVFTAGGNLFLSVTSKLLSVSPVKLVEIKQYPSPPSRIWVEQTAQDFARELRTKYGLEVTSNDIIGGKMLTYRKTPGRYLKKGSAVQYVRKEGKTTVYVKNG